MNYCPTLDEIKGFASGGDYDIAPVSCEILSDFTTPIETMRILQKVSSHCYMLESAQANEQWGRYTFMGYDPTISIDCVDGVLTYKEDDPKTGGASSEKNCTTIKTDDPTGFLRKLLSERRSPKIAALPPFTGGLVG
ncbi:MAG: hypothetical protein K6E92_05365, partial [Lachnospiraceae bacterium]|nr:hypothetical protein [Lachnospiraceae bacterium]